MQHKNFKVITMILGLLLAAAVVCSNVLLQSAEFKQTKKEKTEQKEQTEHQFEFVSAPTITPPAAASIQCFLLAHCLFEIEQKEETTQISLSNFKLHPKKFFVTLFRVIISPNAP